ncbi:MAG: hypothetical protein R3C15_13940 [Thermoleophilia bacterium]
MRRLAGLALISALCAVALAPLGRAAEVAFTPQVVPGRSWPSGRCSVEFFAEFAPISGATGYSVDYEFLPAHFKYSTSGPPFDDDWTLFSEGVTQHWLAPPGAHRLYLGGGTGPTCDFGGSYAITKAVAAVEKPQHRLSGTVTGCPVDQPSCPSPGPLAGISVVATGDGSGRATTGEDGGYAMTLAEGSYVVTPTAAGWAFEPADRTVAVTQDVAGVDFVGSQGHRVTGTITACPLDGDCPEPVGAPGVTVTASGSSGATTTTRADGTYELDLPQGDYTIRPTLADGEGAFTPAARSLALAGDVAGIDFRTCSRKAGEFVPCSGLRVTVAATPSPVVVEQKPAGPVPKDVKVVVTVENLRKTPAFNVTLDQKLLVGYRGGAQTDELALVPKEKRPKDVRLGTIAPGKKARGTYVYVARGDALLDLTALVRFSARPRSATLKATGDGELEIKSKLLVASMTLDRKVRSPNAKQLIKAGTALTARVKLENRSYSKWLYVFEVVAPEGNALGGHWQPPGKPIHLTDFSKQGLEPEALPPLIELAPRQVKEYDVVFTSLGSDPRRNSYLIPGLWTWTTTGKVRADTRQGGTRARLTLLTPLVWTHVDGHDVVQADARKQVLLDPDRRELLLSFDDRAKDVAPYSAVADWAYYSTGIVQGAFLWVGAALHGVKFLAVDLPTMAVGGALELPTLVKKFTLYQTELWRAASRDESLKREWLGRIRSVAQANFDAVIQGDVQVYDAIDRAVLDHYARMYDEYQAGDWAKASSELGIDGAERALDVASVLVPIAAPRLLARFPEVAAAAAAAKERAFAQAGEALSALGVAGGRLPAALAALTGATVPEGMPLSRALAKQLLGLTDAQYDFLTSYFKGKDLLYTFRSRAFEALDWVGAYLKPEQFKIGSVDWIDAEYLGYDPGDVGRLILKKPINRAAVERQLANEGWTERSQRWKDVMDRLDTREFEWFTDKPQYRRSMFEWWTEGEVDFTFNWKDNLVDPSAAPLEQPTIAGFRLARKTRFDRALKQKVVEYVVEVDPDRTGSWQSVVGDIDGVGLTDAAGFGLDDAAHVRVGNVLRSSPLETRHLETASWTKDGQFVFPEKLRFMTKGLVAQVGPDGVIRLVKFNPRLSSLRGPANYQLWFDGGWVAP